MAFNSNYVSVSMKTISDLNNLRWDHREQY